MFHADTHGPVSRTTDAYAAFCAWDVDDTQWILTDGTAYLVGYAPQVFREGPLNQGFRISCPEELMARALAE